MNFSEKRWLTEKKVAEMIDIPVQTLRNKRCQGKGMPYSKIGRSVRYALNDVIAFMEAHRIQREG
jgi:hypothetical protein